MDEKWPTYFLSFSDFPSNQQKIIQGKQKKKKKNIERKGGKALWMFTSQNDPSLYSFGYLEPFFKNTHNGFIGKNS